MEELTEASDTRRQREVCVVHQDSLQGVTEKVEKVPLTHSVLIKQLAEQRISHVYFFFFITLSD